MMGDNGFEGSEWMLSYWTGPKKPEVIAWFTATVTRQFGEANPDEYFAIYDTGKEGYQFKNVVWLKMEQQTTGR
jgi:hypothetical protein